MKKHQINNCDSPKNKTRHVLGLSGGKDSAALAIYIRNNYPEIHSKIEYFFSDTGAELKEVYDFLDKLESYLGKPIVRLGSGRNFEHWLKHHDEYLPSPQQRWCTQMMKIKPFEQFVGDDPVISYIGIRADENREGYISRKNNIKAVFPFIEDNIVRKMYFKYLKTRLASQNITDGGLVLAVSFFQRQNEWLGLKRNHPELFEKAKALKILLASQNITDGGLVLAVIFVFSL